MTAALTRRRVFGIAVVSVMGGVLAAVALIASARWLIPQALAGPVAEGGWTGRSRGWFTARGFFPAETDQHTQAHYSWTADTARLVLPHLDRRQSYRLRLEVSAGRPPQVAPPLLTVQVDGADAGRLQTTNGRDALTVTLPPRDSDRAVISLRASDAFVPAPPDTRTLGVIVRELRLTPDGRFAPTWPVTGAVALATTLVIAAVLVCGIPDLVAVVMAAGIATAFVWLPLQDGAFIGNYSAALLQIAMGAGVIGAGVGLVRAAAPSPAAPLDWPAAIGLTLGATAVKLAFFVHPLAQVGDGIFQLHRAQLVHAGSYFFTSITPRPFFEFPYAIALYVAAMPFWSSFPTDLDRVHLLRGLAVMADALAGLACALAVARQWRSRTALLLVAGLYPFALAPFEALANSNLTNVFGQGLFGLAIGVVGWMAAAGASAPALVLGAVALTASFLSHFSTFSVGVPLIGVVGVALVAAGGPRERRAGLWVLAMTIVAIALAYVAYYSHFTEVYRATWSRILSHEATDATGSTIAATPAVKLQRWLAGTSDDYGLPGVVLAAASILGAVQLARQRTREGMTLVLAGWLAIWTGFTALGLLTAIQMRVNLAAAPLFTCLGAYALAGLARESRRGSIVAAVAAGAIVLSGLRVWLMCLGR
jgi:hypothetical protein